MKITRLGLGQSQEAVDFFERIFNLPYAMFLKRQDAFGEGQMRLYKVEEEESMIGCAVVTLDSEKKNASLEMLCVTEEKFESEAMDKLSQLLKTFDYKLVTTGDSKFIA